MPTDKYPIRSSSTMPAKFPVSTFRCKTGASVKIRPIQPDDIQREREFIRHLSPETRYRRFMSTFSELSPEQLEHFTHPDYDREMAYIALVEENGEEKEIGVCRYAANTADDARDSCEFAIVIADEWQRQGLGRELMRHLIGAAKRHGFKTMVGEFLAENSPMLGFVVRLGFVLSPHPHDHGLKCGVLRLTD
jgi:acetyltransferase